MALMALGRRRLRVVGWGLVNASAVLAWVGCLAISECQAQENLTPMITARSHVYDDVSREVAQAGLFAVPILGVLVLATKRKLAFNRRRQLLSTYLRIAGKALYDGDFDRAIAEYSIAIRVDPARTDSYVKRGQAFLEKGNYDRAVADFNRTLVIDPECAAAYLNRGIVQAARGDDQAALVDFARAIALNPSMASPRLHRGLSLAKVGDAEGAADDFRRILKLTNHSDFTEPARFHLKMIEDSLPSAESDLMTS